MQQRIYADGIFMWFFFCSACTAQPILCANHINIQYLKKDTMEILG